ncbi:c-type cytochrome [Thiohalophilus thiocyanatoxydans]|uniref:Cytochrome c553 n=1 Tax=Thiohalophilus thiocyanatoxydans TaxID=381308 RepID=A0A4R8J0I9_9GAMM|nr:c-type cytochrome [Thiohalophilus thiocyanatoxydans]TDY03669.1 cytochrome c553 [Thiohalophilus thiocyanatoxydans]
MKYTTLVSILAASLFAPSAAFAADGDAEAGEAKAQSCVACHGEKGDSKNADFPKLAGQHAGYTAKQLADFKQGETRSDPIMAGQVAGLSEQDMADLGAYYAEQSVSMGQADEELAKLGEKIYRGGNPDRGVSACIACHGPTGNGNPPANFPLLSGQHTDYLVKALEDFRDGKRTNDQNGMMQDIASNMRDREIEAVASYISGLH